MNSLVFILSFLVMAAISLSIILWPFFRSISRTHSRLRSLLVEDLERLFYEKEILLDNLKDLESDRSLGKLAETDYHELRAKLMKEASDIFEAIELKQKSSMELRSVESEVLSIEAAKEVNQRGI